MKQMLHKKKKKKKKKSGQETMRIALRSNFLISNYLNHVPFYDGNYFILVILCRLPF